MEIRQQSTTWKGEYDVSRAQRAWLDAAPGDATVGHVRVHLGTTVIFSGPRISLLDLGPAKDVAGKRLLVTAVVRRAAPQSTLTSLRVALKGGPTPLDVTLTQAPTGNADVTYVIVVELKGATP